MCVFVSFLIFFVGTFLSPSLSLLICFSKLMNMTDSHTIKTTDMVAFHSDQFSFALFIQCIHSKQFSLLPLTDATTAVAAVANKRRNELFCFCTKSMNFK